MNQEQQILRILAEAGSNGLSVRKLAHHVYNQTNGFFAEVDYDTVHLQVRQYLQRQAARPDGFIRRVSHGVYQLDLRTKAARQLVLDFKDQPDEPAPKPIQEDRSLSLF